jgi:hypothetical protein
VDAINWWMLLDSGQNLLLDLLQPLAGTGDGARDSIIRYGNSAFFWACILLIAWVGHRRSVHIQDRLFLIGVSVALLRDLTMAFIKTLEHIGLINQGPVYFLLPPFEHALLQVAMWTLGGGLIHYLTKDLELTRRFLRYSLSATLCASVSIFFNWVIYFSANPGTEFDQIWYDPASHLIASVGMIILGTLIWRNSIGTVRTLMMVPIVLLFLAEFLQLLDFLTGDIYHNVLSPLRHMAYTFAVPTILLIYLRDVVYMNNRAIESMRLKVEDAARFSAAHVAAKASTIIPENPDKITVDEANAQITEILRSQAFLTSRRSSEFLRYSAAHAVQGNLTKLNAYDIAVNALGQHKDFIPSENAIVRVTALRLRELLKVYYEGEGRDAAIHVNIPRGTYEPQFARPA